MLRLRHTGIAALAFVTAALALAQTTPPATPPAPPPPGQGGPPANAPRDGSQLVDRMMAADANGDGKLSKDELGGRADRIFEVADTNGDGFLERTEIVVFAQNQPRQGPGGERGPGGPPGEGGREGRRGGGGQPMSLEGAMKQANRAMRSLKDSAFDTSSRASDLEQVQTLTVALVNAKGMGGSTPMSKAAKAKFGDDKAAFQTSFRQHMITAITEALALESAILAGKSADAKAAFGRVHAAEEAGHQLFAEEEGN